MKPLLLSILLLSLLIAICFYAAFSVSNVINETEWFLNQSVAHQKNGDRRNAASFTERAISCWEENETLLGMIIRHDAVDDVEREFAGLKAYAHSDDEDDFFSTSAKLLSALHHIRDMEWPFLRNIF